MNAELTARKTALETFIRAQGSLLVSFSGGLDSTLLTLLARQILGDRARCAILDSPLLSPRMREEAEAVSRSCGFSCIRIPFPVLSRESFRANPPDRCYHCKALGAVLLKQAAAELGLERVADGVNLTDYREHRPGIRAASEQGILHPYVVAGITKQDIRDIAREMGLPFWNRSPSACLASRIPYGEGITPDRLDAIGRAEAYLEGLGLDRVRVRSHGRLARIEIDPAGFSVLVVRREEVVAKLRSLGFAYVTLDLEGYRAGSLDEVLEDREPLAIP